MRWLLTIALLLAVIPAPRAALAAQDDDPFADFDYVFLMADALENPSIAGPLSGDLPLEAGATHIEPAGVEVRDYYAHAAFTNPYPASRHLFHLGFSFRRTGGNEEFRLIIDSLGDWYFKQANIADTVSGQVPAFRTGAGEVNEIDLVTGGDTGHFGVNGEFVATIDLSARTMKGTSRSARGTTPRISSPASARRSRISRSGRSMPNHPESSLPEPTRSSSTCFRKRETGSTASSRWRPAASRASSRLRSSRRAAPRSWPSTGDHAPTWTRSRISPSIRSTPSCSPALRSSMSRSPI